MSRPVASKTATERGTPECPGGRRKRAWPRVGVGHTASHATSRSGASAPVGEERHTGSWNAGTSDSPASALAGTARRGAALIPMPRRIMHYSIMRVATYSGSPPHILNREEELSRLDRVIRYKAGHLIVLYGRRRIGALLSRLAREAKSGRWRGPRCVDDPGEALRSTPAPGDEARAVRRALGRAALDAASGPGDGALRVHHARGLHRPAHRAVSTDGRERCYLPNSLPQVGDKSWR